MRITKVSVTGLFGMFDHEIPLNQESRITIVHGPNGVGKTVLMRMVHGLFNYEYEFIGQIRFERLSIFLDNGSVIYVKALGGAEGLPIRYKKRNVLVPEAGRLLIEYIGEGGKIAITPFAPQWSKANDRLVNAMIREGIDNYYPIFFASDDSLWFNRDNFEVCTASDIFDTFPILHKILYGDTPSWFRRIRKKSSTRLIQTQRIQFFDIRSDETPDYNVIDPSDVVRLESAPVQYANRVLSRIHELSAKNLKGAMPKEWTLFAEFLNERLLFKRFSLDDVSGIRVVSRGDSEVPLDLLSSGEQHLLSLYYQLLFEIKRDTLVMIDEPELSMNVVWQRNFLNDLQRIIELRKFDVLIATHSPQIIHDKWDWMVPLGEKVDD